MESADQHYCLRWNNHKANMVTVFQELYYDGLLTDVTIGLSDGLFLECHKLVLAACSPYFRKILQTMDRPRALILVNVTHFQMKALLQFMYHGEVTISGDEMPELLEIANYLKIKGLVEAADIPDSSLRSSSPCEQPRHPQARPQPMDHHQSRRAPHRHVSPSPPPISSSHSNYVVNVERKNGNGIDHMSPPHSTSSPYYVHHKSSPGRAYDEQRFSSTPAWNLPFGPFASTLNGSSMSAHHSSILAAHYDEMALSKGKLQTLTMGRDTPILRTVLGQGNADSSQGAVSLLHPDNPEYRSPSNHSANDNAESKRNIINGSQTHSPYDAVVRDADKKQRIRANGESHREWKRYKQYTKEHIAAAIEAVRSGMSALQAARKFGVPSRTLYDKVKKLGIANSRSMRRSSNNSGAFPYGIGGNKNGSIYAQHQENEYENNPGVFDNAEAMMEANYVKSRDNSNDRESAMELSRVSPSPSPSRSIHGAHQPEADDEDQVEDLSMSSKKSDLRVIVSPTIKEEKADSDNYNHK